MTDAGLIVETVDGRLAVSQWHDPARRVEFPNGETAPPRRGVVGPLVVHSALHWSRFETATPVKQALLHTGMCSVGRFFRTSVRRLLQYRLVTGRRECPIRLSRSFEFLPEVEGEDGPGLRVRDTIELTSPRIRVRRMAFGTDHQAAYVAASGVYQESVLAPWVDLDRYVDQLNTRRRVTIVREL